MPARTGTTALAIAAVTGLIAFALIIGAAVLLLNGSEHAYAALAGGLASIAATAGLMFHGTR